MADLDGEPGVSVGGAAVAQKQINEQVEQDLRTAELYAFPLLFVLSLLFFRSLVAALLPLMVGGLAIVGTFLMLRVASELTSVSIFALNLVTGLGLGLAIDYSLFIVSRYREEIARSGPGPAAMRRTLATAGRTVLFSSLTVAGAIASLAVFPQRFLYSMGIGGFCVALIAAAIALIVLPAVLTLLGRSGQLAHAGIPRAPRRARRAGRPGGLLVPPVAARDALPGAHRRHHRGAADRARPAVLRHQLHVGRRPGAARVDQRAPGRRRAARPVPALPRHARDAGRERWPAGGRARRRRRGRRARGGRGRPATRARRHLRDRRRLGRRSARRPQPGSGPLAAGARRRRARERLHRRLPGPPGQPRSTTCRSCSRSSSRSRSPCCSR